MKENILPYPAEELDGATIHVKDNKPVAPRQAVEFRYGRIQVINGVVWILLEKDGAPTIKIHFSRVSPVTRRLGPERIFECFANLDELKSHSS